MQAFPARRQEASPKLFKPTYLETWFVLVCGCVMCEVQSPCTSVCVETVQILSFRKKWWAAGLAQG